MSTLIRSHDVDLESGNCNSGGGGSENRAYSRDGGVLPGSIGGNEIVRVSENHGDGNKDKEERRESSISECSVEIMDLESGAAETKLNLANSERDCRICHLGLDAANQESGVPIELGCSCKGDLAAAHKQCAEAWFKIKGNRTCEICGSIAQNVTGINEAELTEQWDDSADAAVTTTTSGPASESRNFWQGHRFLNFLLACMVFAFVISWLFHFNVPS